MKFQYQADRLIDLKSSYNFMEFNEYRNKLMAAIMIISHSTMKLNKFNVQEK